MYFPKIKKQIRVIIVLFAILILPVFLINATKTMAEDGSNYRTVRAEHILVKTEDEAWAIKSKIDEGENFEALAKKYSICPSKEKGGDLGYFTRGQMVPEFENAAFSTPIGDVSDPVKTRFGWHLIKIIRKM